MKWSYLSLALSATVLSGCINLAPDYVRPGLPVAAHINGEAGAEQAAVAPPPAWNELVLDPRLKQLVQLALGNNRDLRVAALNVDKARATYRIAEAERYPSISASTSETAALSQNSVSHKYTASLGFSAYELDFFSRIRNLRDADLESYLQLDATQRSTRLTLIAEVVDGWLTLAADQQLLKLAQDTWNSRLQTVSLTQKQKALGAATELSLVQQHASAEAAHDDVQSYTNQVAMDKSALALLIGTSVPESLLPERTETIQRSTTKLLEVSPGISSEVLLQRPDIVAAEHALKASYANIGAARAAFFPAITLTGSEGYSSSSLKSLFDSASRTWSFVPQLTLPIFNAGSLSASLDIAKIQRDIQIATYEKTIQTAFKEVSDALNERQVLSERLSALQNQVAYYDRSLTLTTALYKAGSSSYLDVLDSQRSLYSAQKSLISLQLAEQSNRITLFKVLGGN